MAVIGIAHIGTMGYSLADALARSGHEVLSASDGRSEETRARAEKVGTHEVEDLTLLFQESDFVFSIASGVVECGPAVWDVDVQEMRSPDGGYPEAIDFPLIRAALKADFRGVFVDCNWHHPSQREFLKRKSEEFPIYV